MSTTTSTPEPGTVHKYALTRWDLLHTHIHFTSRNWVFLALFIVCPILVAVLNVRQPEMAARSMDFKLFFVLAFAIIFDTVLAALTMVVLWVMILLRKGRGVLGEHTLEITPAGLVERTEFNETLHRWRGFHRMVRTRRYFYLWVTDSNLHTVPLRSFESEHAVDLFQYQIEEHRKVASGNSAASQPVNT